jgi:heterodisulfide reductase subunit A-like polyferredoxin
MLRKRIRMKHADDSVHGENDLLKPALVLGGGITGLIAARALLNVGIPVTLIAAPQPPDQMICASSAFKQDDFLSALREATQEATVIEVSTWPAIRRDGHLFRARIDHEEEAVFGCLLVAPEVSLAPADSSLPEEAQPISLQGIPDSPCAVAFLLDYSTQSAPAAGMLAMRQALENALKGGQSFVLFKHAPVVHLFGEALYEEARDAGVRFHRFGTELPRVEPIEDASEPSNLFRITVNDVVEAGEPVTFDCEKIVAATYPDASSLPGHARDIADGELDTDGFLLSESIHCHSGCSFRNGVFAIGGATGSLDLLQTLAQASAAAVRARGWMLRLRQRRK